MKALGFVILMSWLPFVATANSCGSGTDTAKGLEDATHQTLELPAQQFVLDGLVLKRWKPPLPPPIDPARVQSQICEGCVQGRIRFGPSAAMRGTFAGLAWQQATRRSASAAAVSDDYESAMAHLRLSLETVKDATHKPALENQMIETALQFGRWLDADKLLEAFSAQESLDATLRSDRLFWKSLFLGRSATPDQWQTDVLPLLEEALSADPTSYQVRVWRVLALVNGEFWRDETSCDAAISRFSSAILDTTEESVCPLMLAHFSHTLERITESRIDQQIKGDRSLWHKFAQTLLAVLAKDQRLVEVGMADLIDSSSAFSCAPDMARSISTLNESAL